jgi:predicted deacetylase
VKFLFVPPGYLVPRDSLSILDRFPLNSAHAFLRVDLLLLSLQFDLFKTRKEVLIS